MSHSLRGIREEFVNKARCAIHARPLARESRSAQYQTGREFKPIVLIVSSSIA